MHIQTGVIFFSLVRYLPGWLPGMGFKRTAVQWNQTFRELTERPYAFAKKQIVRAVLSFDIRFLICIATT